MISIADVFVIEGGRFTGEITGYQYTAYMLLFVPTFFLLLSNSYKLRIIGWGLFALFIIPRIAAWMVQIYNRFIYYRDFYAEHCGINAIGPDHPSWGNFPLSSHLAAQRPCGMEPG